MSELSDRVDGLGPLKLRQSRAIARLIDRQAAAVRTRLAEGTPQAEADEDTGYQFSIGILAAALDVAPAEVEDLQGSLTELPGLMTRVMRLAGFSPGEGLPATTSPLIEASNGSTPPSPPAMDGLIPQSLTTSPLTPPANFSTPGRKTRRRSSAFSASRP